MMKKYSTAAGSRVEIITQSEAHDPAMSSRPSTRTKLKVQGSYYAAIQNFLHTPGQNSF